MNMKEETLLTLKNATIRYGGVTALDGATIELDESEIVALMGPNGAGKSTILKALFGLASLEEGEVFLHNRAIKPVPHEMAARGISYVPQGRQVFKNLTVRENLELGGYALKDRKEIRRTMEEVLELFPALRAKLFTKAGLLSGGQQQMLAIARGLVGDPRALLLDEPSLGLAPKVVKEVFTLIRDIHKVRRIAILVVEHSIKSILEIATRAYVLSRGKVVLKKDAKETFDQEELERVFLHSN